MQIFLKTITLKNFKGIEDATFNFESGETFIHAQNGAGKTSLNDADLWCKFGKDHEDRADYQLKRFDEKGEIVHRIDTEVELTYLVDGVELKLKRIYHENWVKPRTKTEEVLDGNSTIYYINDCEVKKSDYDAKIASLCDNEVFKAITNPKYFPSLSREGQRAILFAVVGDISDEEIAGDNEAFKQLLNDVTGKGFANFRAELRSKITKLKNELDDIDPRIDELNRNKPEMPNIEEIEAEITQKQSEVETIDRALSDIAERQRLENENRLGIQQQINALKLETQKLGFAETEQNQKAVFELQNKLNALKQRASDAKSLLFNQQTKLKQLNEEKAQLQEKLAKLREEWRQITEEKLVFPEGLFECPTCRRPLEIEDIESKQSQMTENFNKGKAERLNKNNDEGRKTSARVKEIEQSINELSAQTVEQVDASEIEALEKQIQELKNKKPAYQSTPEYQEKMEKIQELTEAFENRVDIEDTTGYRSKRKQLEEEVNSLRSRIALKDVIRNTEVRIAQLKAMKKSANQELANLESKEFALKEFEFTKNSEYQERINRMFRYIKFRLFKQQMDGQIVPDFECMLDGVPYGTLNSAGQMKAGLDIINTLSNHYNVFAPIWIDNRESITEIPPMNSQVINLVVDPSYQQLTMVPR